MYTRVRTEDASSTNSTVDSYRLYIRGRSRGPFVLTRATMVDGRGYTLGILQTSLFAVCGLSGVRVTMRARRLVRKGRCKEDVTMCRMPCGLTCGSVARARMRWAFDASLSTRQDGSDLAGFVCFSCAFVT